MKFFQMLSISLLLSVPLFPESGDSRLVSLNGTVTEILYALGVGEKIVAVDTSSSFPSEATRIKKVGYQRTLATEGILSFSPTHIIGTDVAGPPNTIEQLKQLSIPLLIIPEIYNPSGTEEKIRKIAKFINKQKEGDKLAKEFQIEINKFQKPKLNKQVRVLFLYSRSASSIFVSGKNTPASEMIQLSGATNAIDGFNDYKPLTSESIITSEPDVILITKHSYDMLGGGESLWEIPGFSSTRAGKEKNIIVMDDLLLLGFGPRLPIALTELASKWKTLD
jgi:iron complex transport system substrate-binding protein